MWKKKKKIKFPIKSHFLGCAKQGQSLPAGTRDKTKSVFSYTPFRFFLLNFFYFPTTAPKTFYVFSLQTHLQFRPDIYCYVSLPKCLLPGVAARLSLLPLLLFFFSFLVRLVSGLGQSILYFKRVLLIFSPFLSFFPFFLSCFPLLTFSR